MVKTDQKKKVPSPILFLLVPHVQLPNFCDKKISHFKFPFEEQIQKNVYLNFFIFILFYFSLQYAIQQNFYVLNIYPLYFYKYIYFNKSFMVMQILL